MIRNVILAIFLCCQVGVWMIVDNPWSEEKAQSKEITARQLENVAIDEVRRIEITEPGAGSLRLTHRDGLWCIEDEQGYPAIQEKVRAALLPLMTLDRSDFRTDKPFLFEDLNVTEAKARHIKLMDTNGKVLNWLLVGKRDFANSNGTFIRRIGEEAVFVSPEKEFDTLFSIMSRDWYEPGLWDFPASDQQRLTDLKVAIHKVEIEGLTRLERGQSPDERQRIRYVFEAVARDPANHKEAYWRVIEPSDKSDLELDDLIVRSLFTSVLNMRSQEIVSRGLKPEFRLSDLEEMESRVTVYSKEDGVEVSRRVEIGGPKPSQPGIQSMPMHYVRTSHPGERLKQTFVHAISSSYLNVIQRPVEAYVNDAKNKR